MNVDFFASVFETVGIVIGIVIVVLLIILLIKVRGAQTSAAFSMGGG